jgi:hypothetical protein
MTPRLVVPTLLRELVLKACHDVVSAGHPGVNRMLAQVQKQFWWPNYRADVVRYVRTCSSCQRNKSATAKPVGKLNPLPVPTQPWESVSMDFITELPETSKGHNTMLVVVDRFSKMVHLAPCHSSLTASQAADLLIDLIFKLHGTPSSFIADRDKLWTSEFFARWCSKLQVHLNLSSAYHPQTDGQTERMNRLLGEVLRHYVAPSHDNWDQLLPLAEFAINRAINKSTGKSPFVVVYGYQPLAPLDRFHQMLTTPTPQTDKSVRTAHQADDVLRDHKAEFARIADLLRRAQHAQKEQADKHRRAAPDYAVGDKVWVDCKILRIVTVGTPKFLQRWQGPYTITKVIKTSSSNEVTAVTLDLPKSWKVHPTLHVSAVKPYPPDTREAPKPSTVIVEGHEEFHVEEVLDHRFVGRNRKLQFLVKWAGEAADANLWTDEDDLTSDGKYQNQAITNYWAKKAEKAARDGGTLPSPQSLEPQQPKAKAMKVKHKYTPKPKLAKSTTPAWKRQSEAAASEPQSKRRKYGTRSKGAPA